MSFEFGNAFSTTPVPPSLDERLHTLADQLEALVALLAGGRTLPGPLPPADPVQAVQAVQGLKGPATASEIAEALAARLAPGTVASDGASVLAAVEKLTETLDHRLRGLGAAYGAGVAQKVTISSVNVSETGLASESTLSTRATEATLLGRASEGTALDIKRGLTDQRSLFEYEKDITPSSSTNRVVYIGKAIQGTATSAATWMVIKFFYASAQHAEPTDIQVLTGAWTDRAALAWS